MFNPKFRPTGNLRAAGTTRVAALAVVLSAAAFVPAGMASAGSGSPTPDHVAGPCLPTAADDNYATPFETPLTTPAPGVRVNDSDCGFDVQVVSTTANGSLTLNGDGGFTYTPNAGFSGTDGFDYTFVIVQPPAFAGGDRPRGVVETGHADIVVAAPPCVPVAVDDSYETPFNTVLNVGLPGVKVNDTHCDFFVHLFSNPTNGTLTLNADGTFQYTPNAGFSGVDTFEYALAESPPGFRRAAEHSMFGWRSPQGAGDNVAVVAITITPPPPTTTSTTTTTTTTTPATTTTTLPPPTTAVAPQTPTLPATR